MGCAGKSKVPSMNKHASAWTRTQWCIKPLMFLRNILNTGLKHQRLRTAFSWKHIWNLPAIYTLVIYKNIFQKITINGDGGYSASHLLTSGIVATYNNMNTRKIPENCRTSESPAIPHNLQSSASLFFCNFARSWDRKYFYKLPKCRLAGNFQMYSNEQMYEAAGAYILYLLF